MCGPGSEGIRAASLCLELIVYPFLVGFLHPRETEALSPSELSARPFCVGTGRQM